MEEKTRRQEEKKKKKKPQKELHWTAGTLSEKVKEKKKKTL